MVDVMPAYGSARPLDFPETMQSALTEILHRKDSNEAMAERIRGRICAATCVNLPVDVGDVALDCVDAQSKVARYLGVRAAGGQQTKNGDLPRGQVGVDVRQTARNRRGFWRLDTIAEEANEKIDNGLGTVAK